MTNDLNNLIQNRNIRFFISSTFVDLQEERDYLMKRLFPELRRIAAERDVTITEIDLRWGVTEEEAQNGEVVGICFSEIENSIPFFIGILGNRYGWCPKNIDVNEIVKARFDKVSKYLKLKLSLTEMEMRFGVLERDEDMNAFFYVLDNENDINHKDYDKQLCLREAVINNGRYPVAFFTSKEELSLKIKASLIKLLDRLYPNQALSIIEKNRLGQKSYKNQLCQTYISDPHHFSIMSKWLEDWTSNFLVISGESGIGKSALIANWINILQYEEQDLLIIPFFIGHGNVDSDYESVMSFLCQELIDKLSIKNHISSELKLEDLFSISANTKRHILIILDGINEIQDRDNAKLLNWLPGVPNNIKILFTTLNDDETMTVFKRKGYQIYELLPLSKPQREEMIIQYLKKYSKKLKPKQISRIIEEPICKNTLVLKTILDELIFFGKHNKLEERINLLIESKTIDCFYETLFDIYENEYGVDFIKSILTTIYLSRKGLSEKEIIGIYSFSNISWSQFYCAFHRNFHTSNGRLQLSHQFLSKAVANKYLNNKEEEITYRSKIINWFVNNASLQGVFEIPYQLFMSDEINSLFNYLADYRIFTYLFNNDCQALVSYWKKLQNHKYKFDVYLKLDKSSIPEEEYSVIMNQIGYFLEHYFAEFKLALVFYNYSLKSRIAIGKKNDHQVATTYNNIATVYMELGNYSEAIQLYKKVLNMREKIFGKISSEVATTYNNIGTVYVFFESLKALPYLKKALELRRIIFGENSLDVASTYNNIATAILSLRGFSHVDKNTLLLAKNDLQHAIDIQINIAGVLNENLAAFYHNLGLLCLYLNQFKEAIEYFESSIKIETQLFSKRHTKVISNLRCLGSVYSLIYDFDKSIKYYKEALDISRSIFGENDIRVAELYTLIGRLYADFNDDKNALDYFQKALSFFENENDRNWNIIVQKSDLYNSIGFIYYLRGKNHEAIYHYNESLKLEETIRNRYKGHNNLLTISILYNNIARAYFKEEQLDLAFSFQTKALDIQLKLLGDNDINTARSFNNIGLIYIKKKDYKKAIEYLLKGLRIRLNAEGDNRADIADSYENLGDLYILLNDELNALKHFKKAYKINLELFGDNNKKTNDIRIKIISLAKEL